MVNVQLGDDLVAVMRLADEPIEHRADAPIDRLARELIVLELYRRGTISSGKAAGLLSMTRLDFIRYSGSLGIPYFNLTPEELEAEMRTVDELTRS